MSRQDSQELVTTTAATRLGFVKQAFRKIEKARPFIKEAWKLHLELQDVPDITSLLDKEHLLPQLAVAAGISDKAMAHFSDEELAESVLDVLGVIEDRAGTLWREEIVYRFLLTKGDALGGSMRNLVGELAQDEFVGALCEELESRNAQYTTATNRSGRINRIQWGNRVLLFNRRSPVVRKNIDVILLAQPQDELSDADLLRCAEHYLVCGELKGGVDPAGADERWKTAQSALDRVRTAMRGNALPYFLQPRALSREWQRNCLEK